jgi:hypothetical protein
MGLIGEPEEPTSVDAISALSVEVGVNMGDHGQDVVKAIEVRDGETVRDLMDRAIPRSKWTQRKYEHHLVLRFVEPAPPVVDEEVRL